MNPLNSLFSLFQDDTGATSAMRVALIVVVVTVMFVWAWICIAKTEFVPMPPALAGVIASAFAAKAVQARSENQTSTPK